jgi:hypothetical protein
LCANAGDTSHDVVVAPRVANLFAVGFAGLYGGFVVPTYTYIPVRAGELVGLNQVSVGVTDSLTALFDGLFCVVTGRGGAICVVKLRTVLPVANPVSLYGTICQKYCVMSANAGDTFQVVTVAPSVANLFAVGLAGLYGGFVVPTYTYIPVRAGVFAGFVHVNVGAKI